MTSHHRSTLLDPHRRPSDPIEIEEYSAMTTFAEPAAATATPVTPADLLARLRAAVAAHPARTAVHAADGSLDFAALDRRTAALAAALRARGVRRGDRVGVHLARTLDLPVALLAVWRAGAAYVPLDPAYPAERISFMATDARLAAVVSAETAPPVPAGVPVLRPDAAAPVEETDADAFVPDPLDSAYVIYTSGSTGRPKGVEVPHGAVADLAAGLEQAGAYRPEPSVVAWNASVSFDASVQQWIRICRGDTLVVVDDARRADPARLAALLAEHAVTDLDLTPSHWQLLREQLTGAAVPRLFMGGEPVPGRTWRELADGGIDAFNLYGPTECTVDAITARITGPGPHLGEPLAGVRVHLLDERLRPVTGAGEVGELYLAGPGLAHGYAGQPGLTAGRFVADPFTTAPGARMYRTGDQARRSAEGLLEYVGRVDRQVKLRGFRIELGEVEHALAALDGVTAAAVTVHEPAPGDTRLAAYVTGPAAPAELLAELRRTLPAHLVPAGVTVLEAMPLTPNGKVDHRALPVPAAEAAPEAVGGGVAEQVAEVWRTVLGVPEVLPEDDFLSLGGHSLAALRVVHLLRRKLNVELQLRHLLDAADLAAFTEAVQRAAAAGPAAARPALTARRPAVR
ncbi:non-ribosomal peptide synthetase [Kitasatospora purpeofusca]|uniref:non-ribosomal peptide synthetase n=1 Tax=Kitasatospora purpeofusca TaxID=67352 RepID=UPI00225016DE|nr:non-ribosomal peptide synthetase [Kitasatospora purpeofusca]MCX4758387.1 non-ribosomal peptide synthetase [Kitasatospora purpeofusca]WSR31160.1 non-ribosomal peptide synthetase [Kitasatospora purpeofusca]